MAEFSFEKTAKKLADTALNQFEFNGKTIREWVDMLCAIGFPDLEHATNGDIIKALFPHYDIEIDEHKGYVHIFYDDFYTTYPLRWWLEQYKKRGDGE